MNGLFDRPNGVGDESEVDQSSFNCVFMVLSSLLINLKSKASFPWEYRNVVGTHVASGHVADRIKFPVFVAVTSIPLTALRVLPFVLAAH